MYQARLHKLLSKNTYVDDKTKKASTFNSPDNLELARRPDPSEGVCAIGVHPLRPGRRKKCCLQGQVWVWKELGFSPTLGIIHMGTMS